MNITNGGTVSNAIGYIGYGGDSSGTVTVNGSGSSWINSGFLYVGHHGGLNWNDSATGTLNIINGGSVSSCGGSLGNGETSSGTVTVDGSGSLWTNNGNLGVGSFYGYGNLNILHNGNVLVSGNTTVMDSLSSIDFGTDGGTLITNALEAEPDPSIVTLPDKPLLAAMYAMLLLTVPPFVMFSAPWPL